MENLVRIAWSLLALIHAPPAVAFAAPNALRRLYGIAPEGDIGALMSHRGALFLALVALCALAVVDPSSRRAASLAVAISVVSFLVVYARHGLPPGPLRAVAGADAVALLPLVVVLVEAWGSAAARGAVTLRG